MAHSSVSVAKILSCGSRYLSLWRGVENLSLGSVGTGRERELGQEAGSVVGIAARLMREGLCTELPDW